MNKINNFLRSFLQKIGMDKAIAYSSGARIVQGIAGVLSKRTIFRVKE